MNPQEWFRPPRAVLTLFIALMSVCALALGWLGRQVLVQDRVVEAQQLRERLESAADRGVAAIERVLAVPDAEVIVDANGTAEVRPPGRLAYVPSQNVSSSVPPDTFNQAEALEIGNHDLAKAAEAYARLAESDSTAVRAEALVREASMLRKEMKWPDALRVYSLLEKLGATPVEGMPSSLVAVAARCRVLLGSGDTAGSHRCAAALWLELTTGQWTLRKATLDTYLEDLRELAPDLVLPKDWAERVVLADAAQSAFTQPPASGRAAIPAGEGMVSIEWEHPDGSWHARLVTPATWNAAWKQLEVESGAVLRLVDSDGRVIHSNGVIQEPEAFRTVAGTGSPWSLTVASLPDAAASSAGDARRRLLFAVFAVFALVLGLGSFLIARAMGRELAVARLQSDFVAAVSHEFRTPLTSIRQLMEMLATGRVESDEHRQRAYDLMLGQTDRLRRLVESLLDFGRMQARQYQFRSDRLEAGEWSRSVAGEFQETVRGRGYTVELTPPAKDAWIRGDREALGGALWNLLDNAVKYSPDEKSVQLEVSTANGQVQVSVRDRGPGIARQDLKRVFTKFYRGTNAKKQGAKGTGIGLAMVKEIVEAHGGTVRVRSEIGKGSEFTLVLPCRES